LETSTLDSEARSWAHNAAIAEGKRTYTSENLRTDMGQVLSKFIGRGGSGLRSVVDGNLMKGPVSTSRHRTEILKALHSSVLEPHHVSGTAEKAFNVRASAVDAMRFFASNNVFIGVLAQTFERLKADLALD
jgi:hypothetical protein